jgi:8-oxo-dGTP diphosphatase
MQIVLGRARLICTEVMTPVTAAVIQDEQGRILLTQRPAEDRHALKWEFPGGKLVAGESPESCLRRELEEELGIAVEVNDIIHAVNHQYPGLAILLLAYRCRMNAGEIRLCFHQALRWVRPEDLLTFDLVEADKPVARKVLEKIGQGGRQS